MKDVDKPLSLRMAILKLRCGEEEKAQAAEITGRVVADNVGFQLRETGYPPYIIAQFANGEEEVSDEVFELIMEACRCRLYCAKSDPDDEIDEGGFEWGG